MSHFHERKEKNCLNCGTEVAGRYCQKCGQENVEPKESVWHLVTHFFNDITHFDGKFFSTVKYLLLRPGFLTKEYVAGKRMSYLHPIRMYVFTAAFFFLIFFNFMTSENPIHFGREERKSDLAKNKATREELQQILEQEKDSVRSKATRAAIANMDKKIVDLTAKVHEDEENDEKVKKMIDSPSAKIPGLSMEARKKIDSAIRKEKMDTLSDDRGIAKMFTTKDGLHTPEAYLAIQEELPDSVRDGLITRSMMVKMFGWTKGNEAEGRKSLNLVVEKFLHSFPQLLFISLPLFALTLKFLYIRRKNFYYADHGIFAIHFYCAVFLMILVGYVISLISHAVNLPSLAYLNLILILFGFYYLYKAMRNFYLQRRAKTIIKYCLLCTSGFFGMIFLMTIFFIISASRV